MPQTNYQVQIAIPTTRQVPKTVYEEQTVMVPTNFNLSDSMLGVLEDAKEIARQLGAEAIKTEHIALAILTRKTPKNVTTTGGKLLRDDFGVSATAFASAVAAKAGKSRYYLSSKFGGAA